MMSNETAERQITTDSEKAATELLDKLLRNKIVVVTGSSGSGKSTFVRKAFRSYVQSKKPEGLAGERWRQVVTMPFEDPIGNLAMALSRSDDTDNSLFKQGTIKPPSQEDLQHRLREKSSALSQLYEEAVIKNGGEDFNLLLVVDQKQELYRYQNLYREKGDDVRYVNLLLNASKSNLPIYIIFITDSRYFEHFAKYRGLPEVMNNYQFRMPQISEKEIKTFLENELRELAERNDLQWIDQDQFVKDAAAEYQQLVQKGDLAALQKLNLYFQEVLRMVEKVKDAAAEHQQPVQKGDLGAPQKQNPSFQEVVRMVEKDQEKNGFHLKTAALEVGTMASIIEKFMEQKISDLPDDLSRYLSTFLFKELSGKGGDNQFVRRPARFGDLIRIRDRRPVNTDPHAPENKKSAHPDFKDISFHTIKKTLSHFNQSVTLFGKTYAEQFIRVSGGLVPDEATIADIDSDGLLANWGRLGGWIEDENAHASLYRNLVRDAVQYYAGKAGTAPKTTDSGAVVPADGLLRKMMHQTSRSFQKMFGAADGGPATTLYERANLFSINKWERDCMPNANWALRYSTGLYVSDDQIDRLEQTFGEKKFNRQDKSDRANYYSYYDIAVNHFLKESRKKFDDEISYKDSQIKTARRQRRITRWLAMLASGAFLVSIFFAYWAYYERHNMVLVDFVEVLESNGVLDIKRSQRFTKMRSLVDHVVKSKDIRNKNDVLDYLTSDAAGVLHLDQEPQVHDLSLRALINIGDLFVSNKSILKIMGTRDTTALRKDLDAIFKETKALNSSSFRQYPPVYYALQAHQKMVADGNTAPLQTEIYKTALVANTATTGKNVKSAYAFGDVKGFIYVHTQNGSNSQPGVIDTQNGAIYTMCFGSDGTSLLVGFENGDIFRYNHIDRVLPGSDYDRMAWVDTIYSPKNSDGSNVYYFLGEYDPTHLLVRTSDALYFLEKQNDATWVKTGNTPTNDKLMGYVDWTADHRWLMAVGRDASDLYYLDPANRQNPIRKTGILRHDQTTVVEVDIKMDTTLQPHQLWLALGCDDGSIWLWNGDARLPQGATALEEYFYPLEKKHESAITSLEFNPGLPQLASGSREGLVQLWNLEPEMRNKKTDYIGIRHLLSIVDIEYVNKDKLVIYEDLSHWILDTNIDALKRSLDCRCDNQ